MSSMFESISFDMPRPTGCPICFSFGAPRRTSSHGLEAHARLLEEALPILDRIRRVSLGEAVELLRLRVVRALPRDRRHPADLLRHLLDEVGDRNRLLLERRRWRDEPEQVVPALSGDLRGARRVEQRVVDVVDLDLDVVRLAPLLRVRPVEPLVVVGDEMRPRHDPELARELSVGELQRAVGRGEGLSARPPNMLTAKAAALPRLSRSPRVSAELADATSSATSATSAPPFGLTIV